MKQGGETEMQKMSCIDCNHVADSGDGVTTRACRRFGHEFAPLYVCNAKACEYTVDDEHELWICADCEEQYCETHIADLLDEHTELIAGDESGSIFLCPMCLRDRQKIGVTPNAPPPTAEREVA
jgi:hypothetical protein